ncbi:MAG: hypothetical protein V1745_01875 [Patescibacteria group bacterium]
MNQWKRIYDQSSLCGGNTCCPVVDINADKGLVRISDPAKPTSGTFTMTVEEYKTFLANAPRL